MNTKKYTFVAIMLAAIWAVSMIFTTAYVRRNPGELPEENSIVVTSFYPIYIAALNLTDGCETISLQNLSEPQTGCLHDFQLTPEDMKLLSHADLFLVNGGGIEAFLTEVAAAYPHLSIESACSQIALLQTGENEEEEHDEEHDHEEGHEHDEEHDHAHSHLESENAHAWMSISLYREMVKTMAEALCRQFPEEGERIAQNAADYDAKLGELAEEQQALAAMAKNTKVVLFHEAFEYTAKEYGFLPVMTVDLDEERQVSAGEVADVLQAADGGASLILAEELYGKSMAETIQRERDVQVVYLDPLTRGEYEKDSYLTGMKENIRLLQEALTDKE